MNAAVVALIDERDRLDGEITAASREADRLKRRWTTQVADRAAKVRKRNELQAAIESLCPTTTKENTQ